MFTDTHAHLMVPEFDGDRDEVIRRAQDAGVLRIVLIGFDLQTSRAAVDLASSYEGLYATVGIHPCYVSEATDQDYVEIEALTKAERVVGVGETGIDLHWDKTTYPEQERSFWWHIALGRQSDLPVIVHDRDAHDEVMRVLATADTSNQTILLHCFTGDEEMARQAVAAGYYLGFGGIVTFKNNAVVPVVSGIPMDRLLLETDAPYLAPVPHRGRRNESAYLLRTAEAMARQVGISMADLAAITTQNTNRVFKRMEIE